MSNLDPYRITLGNKVRDVSSGFVGTAIYREHQFNGNIRYAIQPPCKADETSALPDIIMLDHNMLDKVDAGVADRSVATTIKYKMGEKARCRITKFSGTICRITEYMNGCVHYLLMEEAKNGLLGLGETNIKEGTVEQETLELIGINAKAAEARAEVEKAGKSTGGPSTRVAHTRGVR